MKKPSSTTGKRKYSESSYRISQNSLHYNTEMNETFAEEQSTINLSKIIDKKTIINYEEELVMFIYYYLLEIIIDDYKVVPSEIKIEEANDECYYEEGNIAKDFYDIDVDELKASDIIYVNNSKVVYSKSHLKNSKQRHSYSKVSTKFSSGDFQSKSEFTNTDFLEGDLPYNEYWMLPCERERVVIKYKNGNVFEGTTYRKLFHGKGIFRWNNGVIYEGEFCNGDATGQGVLYLSDLSYYNGAMCRGLFHGIGTLYISSSFLLYHGNWQAGKKHGKGWLLYGNNNWYDGEWKNNNCHGWGFRQYDTRIRYKGSWRRGHRNGLGTMVYANGDFYTGEWKLGLNDGYGEYTWRAFLNTSFSFALENIYQGLWANGTRDGAGIMNFGIDCGVRLTGLWRKNQKNGPGIIICRNGSIIQGSPLFVVDKPIHVDRYNSMSELHEILIREHFIDKVSTSIDTLLNFETYSKKSLTSHSLKSISDMPKYTPKCNPIDIPIYAPPETIYLMRYINRIVYYYDNFKSKMYQYVVEAKEKLNSSTSRKWNVYATYVDEHQTKLNLIDEPIDDSFEEKTIRLFLRKNADKLRKLYNYYASLCHRGPVEFDLILIRLFFWQVYRDIGLTEKYSMVEMDDILFENPDAGFELTHNPFEKIYYWQFLHCLIEISLTLYENYASIIDFKQKGILASIFNIFLENLLERNCLMSQNLYNPYAYLNLLPIESVYLLYESIGQPHTAKTFLRYCCYEKGCPLLPFTKTYNWNSKRQVVEGINMTPVGENITYYSKKHLISHEEVAPVEDLYFKYLFVFRNLGARKIIHCLSTVCPLIIIDCVIANMEYKLTFLEFYETLIFCSYMMVNEEKQKEYELRVEEQKVKDNQSKVIVEKPQKSKKKK